MADAGLAGGGGGGPRPGVLGGGGTLRAGVAGAADAGRAGGSGTGRAGVCAPGRGKVFLGGSVGGGTSVEDESALGGGGARRGGVGADLAGREGALFGSAGGLWAGRAGGAGGKTGGLAGGGGLLGVGGAPLGAGRLGGGGADGAGAVSFRLGIEGGFPRVGGGLPARRCQRDNSTCAGRTHLDCFLRASTLAFHQRTILLTAVGLHPSRMPQETVLSLQTIFLPLPSLHSLLPQRLAHCGHAFPLSLISFQLGFASISLRTP